MDRWGSCDVVGEDFVCSQPPCSTAFSNSWLIYPNDLSFPVSAVVDHLRRTEEVHGFVEFEDNEFSTLSSRDLSTAAISIYTNLIGILNTHRGCGNVCNTSMTRTDCQQEPSLMVSRSIRLQQGSNTLTGDIKTCSTSSTLTATSRSRFVR